MRRIPILVATALLALQALAAPALREPGMQWVKRAPLSAALMQQAISQATLADVGGPRPVVLLETNNFSMTISSH